MSGDNSKNDNITVLGFASAIVSKINSLISSHNSNTSAHSDKESTSNKVTSWSSTVSDTKYASEKLVKDSLDAKQNILVSGTSIKTINNQSLLGSGNISIAGGSGSSDCLTDFSYDSTNDELVLEYCSGKLIDNISKTTSGLVDTYTITYTDATTYQFTVTNGGTNSGGGGSEGSITVDSSWISNSTNPVQSQVIKTALDGKANSSHTHTISNITDFPTIPSKISDLTDDSDFISASNTSGLIRNDGTIDTSTYLTTGNASSTYVAKETGKGLFSGSYADLTSKPSYTATITSTTAGAYEIGKINISGSNVTIYGKDTHQSLTNYIQTSSTTGLIKNDGSIMTSGTGSTNYAAGNHTHSAYVNPTICDNLTTNDASQVLSAKQGKILNDLIGSAISYINQ